MRKYNQENEVSAMNVTMEERRQTYSNIPAQFMGCCDGRNIYIINGFNQKSLIGVTQQSYDELQGICQGYYDKLVELGAIKPPKTPEQLQAEQAQAMADMLDVIKGLKQEVEELKNGRKEYSTINEFKPGEDSKADAGVAAGAAGSTGSNYPTGRFERTKR
jgi:hypothetical protein